MKHIKELKLNEDKDYPPIQHYPEFKEMRYSNIAEVKRNLESLNKFYRMIHPQMDRVGLTNDSADMWRKIERSIELLDKELNLNK